jgi:hypothetical protein
MLEVITAAVAVITTAAADTTAVAAIMVVADTITAAAGIMAVVDTITAAAVIMVAADTITAVVVITRTADMDTITRTLVASGMALGMHTVLAPAGAGRPITTSTYGFALERRKRLANDPILSKTAMLNRGLLLLSVADALR